MSTQHTLAVIISLTLTELPKPLPQRISELGKNPKVIGLRVLAIIFVLQINQEQGMTSDWKVTSEVERAQKESEKEQG